MAWTKASVRQKSLFSSFLFLGGSSIWNMLWLLPGPPSTLSEQTGRKMWGVGCPFPAQGLPCCCWLCLLGWVFPREEMRWGLLLSPLPPSLVSMRQAMGPEITRRAEWQHVCRRLPDHPRSQPHWVPWTGSFKCGPRGHFRRLSGSPTETRGLLAVSPRCPRLVPHSSGAATPGSLGTLTACWSRHGWQEYSKLENWQYLLGPQSSSMMHSCGGEEGAQTS